MKKTNDDRIILLRELLKYTLPAFYFQIDKQFCPSYKCEPIRYNLTS